MQYVIYTVYEIWGVMSDSFISTILFDTVAQLVLELVLLIVLYLYYYLHDYLQDQ